MAILSTMGGGERGEMAGNKREELLKLLQDILEWFDKDNHDHDHGAEMAGNINENEHGGGQNVFFWAPVSDVDTVFYVTP